jgi:hypothetical protein
LRKKSEEKKKKKEHAQDFLQLSTIKEDKVCDENKMDVMIKEILDLGNEEKKKIAKSHRITHISRAYTHVQHLSIYILFFFHRHHTTLLLLLRK